MIEVSGDLDRLAVDLGRASFDVVRKVTAVTHKGANNVKRDARKFAAGMSHAPHYPRSITYDVDFSGGTIAAEIGPDKNLPQGALGNILEYGTVNNPPHAHLGPALDREEPQYVKHVADAAVESLW